MRKHKIVTIIRCHFAKRKTNGYGFTLIELMFVMAIFSVLAAVGLYSVNQYLPRQRKLAAVRIIKADMVKARVHAIRERQNQTLDIQNNKYRIHDNSETFIERNFENDYGWGEIQIQSDSDPVFNPDGTITDISTIVIDSGDSEPLSITMTITGNISIEE
ncbi:MAG: pilin assembly protein [Candidatus Magnetoglobus multicellularis str. Araruama]|uniref:Pilin assembly protein n=1 Tax=Candidatus Magnetoglobus multicellularis str. Araruama TaxID=890399 RepID=A0A1V1PBX4_9BACT|nr:MAG: pilin assembly protein [Candidatus Magnetoglobus multicellularis str. Araruama]